MTAGDIELRVRQVSKDLPPREKVKSITCPFAAVTLNALVLVSFGYPASPAAGIQSLV